MPVPSIFIVGAPRCGTSSLWAYLAAHPRVFMPAEKEPHHFGADLGLRMRPYAERERYLQLFASAGDRLTGEASVLYLYSQTAPREILELSPDARVIIMLRDPAEMIPSLYLHNLVLVYEDLPTLDEALDAEADRREGRRIPRECLAPPALLYTALGRYSEHVRRYQEAFGPSRVKVILFDDFKKDTEAAYRDTLAFLGLEPGEMPDLKAQNTAQRWRSQGLARLVVPALIRGSQRAMRLESRVLRGGAMVALALGGYLPLRLNVRTAKVPSLSAHGLDMVRRGVGDDVARLGSLLGRDLSSWLRPRAADAA